MFAIILILIAAALVVWLVRTYMPAASEPFKTILVVLIVLAVIAYLLELAGVLPSFAGPLRR